MKEMSVHCPVCGHVAWCISSNGDAFRCYNARAHLSGEFAFPVSQEIARVVKAQVNASSQLNAQTYCKKYGVSK